MKAVLALEDGFTLEGTSFTGEGESSGELVFYTAMCGFTELVTRPSLYGTLLCLSYTEVGNAGICQADMLSAKAGINALLVKKACKIPSNWRSEQSLPAFLEEQGVLGVENLDTRALRVHLRDNGPLRGVISTHCQDPQGLVEKAKNLSTPYPNSTSVPWSWRKGRPDTVDFMNPQSAWVGDGLPVVILDFGVTRDTLRSLEAAGCELLMLPPEWEIEKIKALRPAMVVVSDGRADPARYVAVCDKLAELAKSIPVFGCGFGQTLLGQAFGGIVNKLKQGNYGFNHPVQDVSSRKVNIATLCQPYGLDISAAKELELTHVHLHDSTVQGFVHKTLPAMGWQFQPDRDMFGEVVKWVKGHNA